MATEKRLIDVTEPLKLFRGWLKQLELPEDAGDKRGVESCIAILEDEPTVDAVEVVHGHWCWEGKFKACSRCGSYVEWDETLGANFWKFCPYCGAKMDGDTE